MMKLTRLVFKFINYSLGVVVLCTNLYSRENDNKLISNRIVFVENKGQLLDDFKKCQNDILFYTEGNNAQCLLKKNGLSYLWSAKEINKGSNIITTNRMDVEFLNANTNLKIRSENPDDDFNNYYLSNCPKAILNVKKYNKITYENIYDNIDLVIYTSNADHNLNPLKYDFIVRPGGNAQQIKIKYSGSDRLSIHDDGSLSAYCPIGELKEGSPYTYQNSDKSDRISVASKFKLIKKNVVAFDISEYDHNKILVIDPSIQWATYYGGAAQDYGGVVCTDPSGNSYLVGKVASSGLASSGSYRTTLIGSYNLIVVKFGSTGSRLWATYFGGGSESVSNVACDPSGSNIYIAGFTTATTNIAYNAFQPTYGGGANDAILVKFNSSGTLQWSTYYGGTATDQGFGVAVDNNNDVYLSGTTESSSGIATAGAFQTTLGPGTPYFTNSFLAKFNSSGSRIWATYYGAGGPNGASGNGKTATDSYNNVYLYGQTATDTLIATDGVYQKLRAGGSDVYLVKFSSAGTRKWGTYFGGPSVEYARDIRIDPFDNVFISGYTYSTSGIASTGAHQTVFGGGSTDDFIAKFSTAGTILWSTYYGGTGNEGTDTWWTSGLGCFSDGKIVFGSGTTSTNGIATAVTDEVQTFQGVKDGYLVKMDASGKRVWATYYGGSQYDEITGLTIEKNSGSIYFSGSTASTSGIASGGFQNTFGGGSLYDIFLGKINIYIPPVPTITTGAITGTYSCGGIISVPFTTTGTFNGGNVFTVQGSDKNGSFSLPGFPFTLGSGTTSPISITLPYAQAGTQYRIRVVSSNPPIIGTYSGPFTATDNLGSNINHPIDVGTLGSCTQFTDTRSNTSGNCYGNDYDQVNPIQLWGQSSSDIYYKFTLTSATDVTISACSSTFDTYLHLLNNLGNNIISNDDNGPMCSGLQSSIIKNLNPGVYYVVAEGYSGLTGTITTKIATRPALLFDGSNDKVEVTNNSVLNLGTGPFTFEAFVKLVGTGATQIISSKRNSSQYEGFMFGIWGDKRLWLQVGGTNIYPPVGVALVDNTRCYHVAVTRSSSNVIKFYIDGVLAYTYNSSSISVNSTGAMRMGIDNFSGFPFNGYLRNVRVWNVERTASQILSNINTEITAPQTNLISYWKMIEGSPSQTIADVSGNTNTGTLGSTTSVETSDPTWSCQIPCVGTFKLREEPFVYNVDSTSIARLGELDIRVYPNPFAKTTSISVFGQTGKVKVEIYNTTGALLYRNEEYETNEIITLGEDTPSGIYFGKVMDGSQSKIFKLIKTK